MKQEFALYILRCIGRPATTKDVARFYYDHTDMTRDQLTLTYTRLDALHRYGLVRKVAQGKFKPAYWEVVE